MDAINERAGLDELFDSARAELRQLGLRALRRNGAMGISATTLVHETWLKLAHSPAVASAQPLHFRRIVAQAMRHILIDLSRRRNAKGRGSGRILVTFDDELHNVSKGYTGTEILALDEALNRLARIAPRQAQLVEGRFFGGLTWKESAESFGISEATVMREWRAARAWLAVEIRN